MATKFLNISTDSTLGGNSPADEVVSSQKALKTYIDSADDNKVTKNNSNQAKAYGTTSGGVETTWEVSSSATASTLAYRGINGVLAVGTPTDNTHAATKKYVDDSIPTVNNATLTITQGGVSKGTFTANASSDVTIALDSGGSGTELPDQTGHSGEFLTTDGSSPSWAAIAQTLSGLTDTTITSATSGQVLKYNGFQGTIVAIKEGMAKVEVPTYYGNGVPVTVYEDIRYIKIVKRI